MKSSVHAPYTDYHEFSYYVSTSTYELHVNLPV